MSTYKTMVIFATDDQSHEGATLFADHCKQVGISDKIKLLVGCYEGVEEVSYIMPLEAFTEHVLNIGLVHDQESFLHVSGCNKAYAVLHYQDGREPLGLGSMCQVKEDVARTYPAWTYRPDTKAWYIAHKANPDHSKEIGPYAGS